MKMSRLKKISIIILSVILLFILWYFLSNPASSLGSGQVKEAALYSIQTNRSLWDLGYNPDDFAEASPQYGDFKYNAVFKGDALTKVLESLSAPSRSYYTFPQNSDSNPGLYAINIRISDDEGFTFILDNADTNLNGRFTGYKYKGSINGQKTWIVYYNDRLAQTLEELRSK